MFTSFWWIKVRFLPVRLESHQNVRKRELAGIAFVDFPDPTIRLAESVTSSDETVTELEGTCPPTRSAWRFEQIPQFGIPVFPIATAPQKKKAGLATY